MNTLPLLALLAYPALIAPATPPKTLLDREVMAMGTRLSLHLEGDPAAHLTQASEGLLAEVERIEIATSTWRPDSAWSRLNTSGGEALSMDPEWIRLLIYAQAWAERTQGAFDPVLGALLKTWGTREGGRIPSPEALARARSASGTALLQVDVEAGTARLRHLQAGLEEGGFLKGYALDAARRVAETRGSRIGLLDFGGQLLAWGRAVEAEVADPRDRQRPRLRLRLENASLSSSGCSERGQHILDPRSGVPCPDWGAVSVVAPLALDADVLSTALFVMGPERGPVWAEHNGIAAVFLPHRGQLRMTSAFQKFVTVIFKEHP